MFEFLFYKNVYCQNCGEELTKKGGYVGGNRIYCSEDNCKCLIEAFNLNNRLEVEYKNAEEVQEEIKSKNLIVFSKLENHIRK